MNWETKARSRDRNMRRHRPAGPVVTQRGTKSVLLPYLAKRSRATAPKLKRDHDAYYASEQSEHRHYDH